MSKFSGDIAEDVAARLLTHVPDSSNNVLTWRVAKHESSAFTGGTANTHGDHDGTADPYTIFTVTGDVLVRAVFGIVNTDLAGASATIEVGVTGNTAKLIAQSTATDLDDGDVWTDTGAEAGVDVLADSGALYAINDGVDVIETVATANITAGQIDYYCIWAPLEPQSSVVSA